MVRHIMRNYLLFSLFPFFLLAQIDPLETEPKPVDPKILQFENVQKRFNPWYSGPLLEGSATMMPAGAVGVQTYLFAADNYAIYHQHAIPDLIQLTPQINAFQVGLAKWLDASVSARWIIKWQNDQESEGFGDTTFVLGFPLMKESLHLPAMKLGIGAIFPTGRYEMFTPNKSDVQSLGQGSTQILLSYRISKIFLWESSHPLNVRATVAYHIPSTTLVRHFNTYGGGYGTFGTVRPGNQINATVGVEWSFLQHWVILNDFVYVYNNHATFSGDRGVLADGSPAPVGLPSNSQISLAPAIEYNPAKWLNLLSCLWFTAGGRNSFAFVQGVFSLTFTWNVE